MKPIDACHLYGILDFGYVSRGNARETARRMIEGGIDILQIRAKKASEPEIASLAEEVHELTYPSDIPLVINDHPKVARLIHAEGVHLGQDDLTVSEGRDLAGACCFIGKSTHSLDQAKRAEAEGANYIGFGPLFATPTKPDYPAIGLEDVRAVHEAVKVPIFCIGGIKAENAATVLSAGAKRLVVVSGILLAPDVQAYVAGLKRQIEAAQQAPNTQPT